MSAAEAKNSDKEPTPPKKSTVVLLFTIAADTTWRMFLPVIGATILGVWGDRTLATKPWLTILGIVVGVIVASLLVRAQIRRKVI